MKQIKPFHFPKLQNCNTKNICPFNIEKKKQKKAANQGKGNEFKSVKTNKQTNEAHKMEKRRFSDV